MLTSGNAARALQAHPQRGALDGLPVFAVGQRSAQAARDIGFTDVMSADGDVTDLAGLVVERVGEGTLLYLAGEDRAGDLAGELADHGLDVRTAVVYRAVPVDALPDPARAALGTGAIDGVLHYSRRSAEVFVDRARQAGVLDEALASVHYCLSPQVADRCGRRAGQIRPPRRPDEAALFELLGRP